MTLGASVRLLRPTSALVAVCLLLSGCAGLGSDPVVEDAEAVRAALGDLRVGARMRATIELAVDEDEVRDVLRDDPDALALLGDDAPADVDGLLAEVEDVRDQLAEHALLLSTGADRSVRAAAEHDGVVWLDVRAGGDVAVGVAEGDEPRAVDLQLRVDWATAADLADQPDLLGDLDDLLRAVVPPLADGEGGEAVTQVLTSLLAGELVGVTGSLDRGDAPGPLSDLGRGVVDPQAVADAALLFDGFRRDGQTTAVDVSVDVAAVREVLRDADDEAGDDAAADRLARLDDLPDVLTDVAVLRFGPAGVLRQVRVDLLDTMLQVAAAAAPDDERAAAAERLAGELDESGVFLLVDVEEVGGIDTVLGDPAATVAPDELVAALVRLAFGGLGGGLFGDLGGLGGLGALDAPTGPSATSTGSGG